MKDSSIKRRVQVNRKPRYCPECGSVRIAKIMYGMPVYSTDLQQKISAGEIAIGGCEIDLDSPNWQCADCWLKIYYLKSDRHYLPPNDYQHLVGKYQKQLDQFISAQENQYRKVLIEIKKGHKETHWMWYIFPQIAGLSRSEIGKKYAIQTLEHARAYYSHPILGERLRECTKLLLSYDGLTANEIFGTPDDLKLNSCMTLFFHAIGTKGGEYQSLFEEVIVRYFQGKKDRLTQRLLFNNME